MASRLDVMLDVLQIWHQRQLLQQLRKRWALAQNILDSDLLKELFNHQGATQLQPQVSTFEEDAEKKLKSRALHPCRFDNFPKLLQDRVGSFSAEPNLKAFEETLDEVPLLKEVLHSKIGADTKVPPDVEILIKQGFDFVEFVERRTHDLSQCFFDLNVKHQFFLQWLQLEPDVGIVFAVR